MNQDIKTLNNNASTRRNQGRKAVGCFPAREGRALGAALDISREIPVILLCLNYIILLGLKQSFGTKIALIFPLLILLGPFILLLKMKQRFDTII